MGPLASRAADIEGLPIGSHGMMEIIGTHGAVNAVGETPAILFTPVTVVCAGPENR